MASIIYRCCQIKAEVVGKDEREASLRAILNFGHTYGHALEAVTGFGRILHGEAVAIGMVVAARLSHQLGHSPHNMEPDVRRILGLFGLPTDGPLVSKNAILKAIGKDKKSTKNKVTFIIVRGMGRVECVPIDPWEILKCL
jgi:3-dehydroquinate synthase